MLNQKEFEQRAQAVEDLVKQLESQSAPGVQAVSKALLQAVLDLHAAGLERMLEIVDSAGESARKIVEQFCGDDLVKNLLLLHGLHPLGLESRVRAALERSKPYLRSQGGTAELVSIDDAGLTRVRVESGSKCSASAVKQAVEQAVYQDAPDVTELIIESAAEDQPDTAFVPLEDLFRAGNDRRQAAAMAASGMEPSHP